MAAENTDKPQPEISIFGPGPQQAERGPWRVFAVVAVALAALIGTLIIVTRAPSRPRSSGPPPYAQQLAISNLKLSQVQNFVGATVTYIDGSISNNGDRTVSGADLQATFRNSLNEVVDQQEQPLRILRRSGAYPEALDLSMSPLTPHQAREFRLTFEHISSDWNQQLPQLAITQMQLR